MMTGDGERHISIDLTAEQWSHVADALERWYEQGLDSGPDYELRYGGNQLSSATALIREAVALTPHVHSLRGGGHFCVDCGKDME